MHDLRFYQRQVVEDRYDNYMYIHAGMWHFLFLIMLLFTYLPHFCLLSTLQNVQDISVGVGLNLVNTWNLLTKPYLSSQYIGNRHTLPTAKLANSQKEKSAVLHSRKSYKGAKSPG